MRLVGAVVLATMVGGCTSVRMVQREGCWVRRTERWLGQVEEEMGPCARPPPAWVEDRLTRLVQECVAQADYRWQSRALAVWSRREPVPAQEDEQSILERCMNEAATAMVTENETLKTRLGELSMDRDTLRASVETDRAHLRKSHDRIASALGEAAKRPPPAAVATATSTSDGSATTQSDASSQTPAAPGLVSQPLVCAQPGRAKAAPQPVRTRKKERRASAPECGPKAEQKAAPQEEPAGSAQVQEVVAPAPDAPAPPAALPQGEEWPQAE